MEEVAENGKSFKDKALENDSFFLYIFLLGHFALLVVIGIVVIAFLIFGS